MADRPAVSANTAQIDFWNSTTTRAWADRYEPIDRLFEAVTRAAMSIAAPKLGEQVLDLGCGGGTTVLELASRVGPTGYVLGADVSENSIASLRRRIADAGLRNADAILADISTHRFPAARFDLAFSRFGVMFFGEPTDAFRHLRAALRAGGRCVFVCWRTPRDNAWAMAPLAAARAAMAVTPPPADPNAPGPFAFADEARVRTVLSEAGFARVEFTRFDQMLSLGETPQDATDYAMRIGPTSRFAREMGDAHLPTIRKAVEQAFAQLAAPDGRVNLVGSTWIVSATNAA